MNSQSIYLSNPIQSTSINSITYKENKKGFFRSLVNGKWVSSFFSNWAWVTKSCHILNNSLSRSSELSHDQPLFQASSILSGVSLLNSGDVVGSKRNQFFEDNGFYDMFQSKHVFIEAYGHGDNPLIRGDDDNIEIVSSTWF